MSNTNEPLTFTQEEIEYAERHLKAEIQKLERAIERKKKEIEDLQPKGFWGTFNSNKSKIKEAEEELAELEEVEDNEGEFLEPLEEINEYSNVPEEKEILETKNASTPMVPVYSAEIPAEDLVMSDDLEQGDTVTHAKYGNGVVEKMIKYGSKT